MLHLIDKFLTHKLSFLKDLNLIYGFLLGILFIYLIIGFFTLLIGLFTTNPNQWF